MVLVFVFVVELHWASHLRIEPWSSFWEQGGVTGRVDHCRRCSEVQRSREHREGFGFRVLWFDGCVRGQRSESVL
jgi:hypothetical protein